jgi:hypothetical protein
MTTADDKIERLADRLQAFATRSAAEGGTKGKLARPLAEDAAFVRKLKPSLIKARARGEAPTDQPPSTDGAVAPSGPQLGRRPKQKARRSGGGGGGPNPWLVMGVCLAAGIFVAKWIDWRGHAHPKR